MAVGRRMNDPRSVCATRLHSTGCSQRPGRRPLDRFPSCNCVRRYHSRFERTLRGSFRIQIGSLDQKIHMVARQRHFGGRQWFFVCPYTGRRAMVLWMPPGAHYFACSKSGDDKSPTPRNSGRRLIGRTGAKRRSSNRRYCARDQKPAQLRQQFLGRQCRTHRRIAGGARQRTPRWEAALRDRRDSPIRCKATSTKSFNTASAPTRSSRTCCCTHVEGSGEHRPVDVNALVEESLNLAYHGARAEKQGSLSPWSGPLIRPPASRCVPAGDHAGSPEPDLERLLCGDQTQRARQ